MKGNIEKDILKFTKICKSLTFVRNESFLKKSPIIDSSKLEHNPSLRGQLIEGILINKILLANISKSIHNVEGRLLGYQNQYYSMSSRNHKVVKTKSDIVKNINWQLFCEGYTSGIFPKPVTFNSEEIVFKKSSVFKAKVRCLTKPVLEYCFIDLIIDHTIIDIKTDIHTKALKKHIKQVFIYAIMYASYLKSKKEYNECFSPWEIEMLNIPIENIAIYFWRTNEFYSYKLTELISPSKFMQLVNIYTQHISFRTQLRAVMRKHLFDNAY